MRIRTVKPEFFTHPDIVRLSLPARLLFISLLNQADDEGRLYDQPRKIGGLAFAPHDVVDVEELLRELARTERIWRYQARARACIQIVNFRKHQRIDKPSKSTIPAAPRGYRPPPDNQLTLDESSPKPRRRVPVGMEQGTGNGTGNRDSASLAVADANGDGVWEWMVSKWGQPPKNRNLRTGWGVAAKEIRDQGLSLRVLDQYHANAGSRAWAIATPMAFAKHMGILAKPEPRQQTPTDERAAMVAGWTAEGGA